jgi:hypothetical protein
VGQLFCHWKNGPNALGIRDVYLIHASASVPPDRIIFVFVRLFSFLQVMCGGSDPVSKMIKFVQSNLQTSESWSNLEFSHVGYCEQRGARHPEHFYSSSCVFVVFIFCHQSA